MLGVFVLENGTLHVRKASYAASAMPQYRCGQGNREINDQCPNENETLTYACEFPAKVQEGPRKGALCARGAPCSGTVANFEVAGHCVSAKCCQLDSIDEKTLEDILRSPSRPDTGTLEYAGGSSYSDVRFRIDEAFDRINRSEQTNYRIDDAFQEIEGYQHARTEFLPDAGVEQDAKLRLELDNRAVIIGYEFSDVSPETRASPAYQDLIHLSNMEGPHPRSVSEAWIEAGVFISPQEYFDEFYDAVELRPPIQPGSTFTIGGDRWDALPRSQNIEDRRPSPLQRWTEIWHDIRGYVTGRASRLWNSVSNLF